LLRGIIRYCSGHNTSFLLMPSALHAEFFAQSANMFLKKAIRPVEAGV
jgi:hypothetical protein